MKDIRNKAAWHRRRGIALLMTLLVVVLLIAVVSRLTTATATQALIESRRQQTLRHELALDSLSFVMRDWFVPEGVDAVVGELDRQGFADRNVDIGPVKVRARVRDDATKVNPNRFGEPHGLESKLDLLATRLGLNPASINLAPLKTDKQPYRTFGQVLSGEAAAFTPLEATSSPAWSDVLTLWGDGRVALRRADETVLDVVLEDLKPDLGRELLKHRLADRSKDFLEEALSHVDAQVRENVRQRIVFDSKRYSLNVETSIDGDRRSWYLVVKAGKEVTVLHRRAVTW